ncbi:MAG: Na(+)-translocating NADH-quinone reductase subunit A [Chlamydiales bacterium]|nr:Na(+)-translocating NADH-quinone reductase subunit A [Chlamydiales bacterium]
MDIKVKKGLNIPIKGKPSGNVQSLAPSGQPEQQVRAKQISLNLWPFEELRLKLLKKVGDTVKIGEPIAEDKGCPGRYFVAPAAGTVKDVRRGLKRRILDIVIDVAPQEEAVQFPPLKPEQATRQQIIDRLMEGGLFIKIRQRPFNILAQPHKTPRSIFVKAIETTPFTPPAEMQVKEHEEAFATGLAALTKLTDGPVHLVYGKESNCSAFTNAAGVQKHTVSGPHPAGTHSLHIHNIDPITSVEDVVWTLDVHDVICIGELLNNGRYYTERVISIAGPAIIEGQTGYFRVREGMPIAALVAGRLPKGDIRLISGDPLMGSKVSMEDFLGVKHYSFTAIEENTTRELLAFMRLGVNKFSYSRAYFSGHIDPSKKDYNFTTTKHGEHRPFIDPAMYIKVMPMNIPTMQLVKAVMAEDYDLAEELGLLEVAPEDFALSTFVCPSKMEMTDIIKQGLHSYAAEVIQ